MPPPGTYGLERETKRSSIQLPGGVMTPPYIVFYSAA